MTYRLNNKQNFCLNGKNKRMKNKSSLVGGYFIGPSGVRALPLAAGRNEGGHYFHYKNMTALFREYNRVLPPYNLALPGI